MDCAAEEIIQSGKTVLGLELGSTRIKAHIIDPNTQPLASGECTWESTQVEGIWSYSLEDIWSGIVKTIANLKSNVFEQYGVEISAFTAIGLSGMMHGYMAFDAKDNLLVPFRTWRNTITENASTELTRLFQYPIPQRGSIAHLHQSVLNNEAHLEKLAFITTLSGYVHWRITGKKAIGIGDASGMFPINTAVGDFNSHMIDAYNSRIAAKGYVWNLREILPEIVLVGNEAGRLTETGAMLLDPSGEIRPGCPLCPPEGDAGTGMVATNSIRVRTGNVSAGTSVFAMIVMEKEPARLHEEIDFVTTPDGRVVGMVHSNNCTSDYDAWINLFGQAIKALGGKVSTSFLYETLLKKALEGDDDCGGFLAYGYVGGEHITGFPEGRPLFLRPPGAPLQIENFMRTHLFTSLCALKTGLNILMEQEGVKVDCIRGHGGFFKTATVGQRIMAAATGTPISLMETAGEGGSWGIALLAAYMVRKNRSETLPDFLDALFVNVHDNVVRPVPSDVEGFNTFFKRYHAGLKIEGAAVKHLI